MADSRGSKQRTCMKCSHVHFANSELSSQLSLSHSNLLVMILAFLLFEGFPHLPCSSFNLAFIALFASITAFSTCNSSSHSKQAYTWMRSKQRSSSSSNLYVSTPTILALVALCILGAWVVTSDRLLTPRSVIRSTFAHTGLDASTDILEPEIFAPAVLPAKKPPFEGNPGDFPDDIVRDDMPEKSQEDEKLDQAVIEEDANGMIKANGSEVEHGDVKVGKDHITRDEIGTQDSKDVEESMTEESTGFDTSETSPKKNHTEDKPAETRKNEHKQKRDEKEQPKQEDETVTFSDENTNHTEEALKKLVVDIQQESDHAEDKPSELNPLLNAGIPKESNELNKTWATQAALSHKEKQRREGKTDEIEEESLYGYTWMLCNVSSGPDYIPCLDNEKALKRLRSTKHFEHRERHCPEDPPTCLVPLPTGYKKPIRWPDSRNKIWFHNVPHTELAKVKGHQNWMKVTGEFLTFPGGGTQFIHGALSYIGFIEKISPGMKLGKHTRVVLDVGCGVASFGGYLFEKDVLTMSFAPKDEHEAQVQFAVERGIPAISAVMGSQRLPFPSGVFDVVHCARCRVPWHAEGGRLLLEVNRVLRPGGCFIWSATPVYQNLEEDVEIWEAMSALTASMCWKFERKEKDTLNKIGLAIFRKPIDNECYDQRQQNSPPMCKPGDDPNAAWYVPLQSCLHRLPTDNSSRGSKWPLRWPKRLRVPPYWLNETQMGIYGKPAPDDFVTDYKHWQRVVKKLYLNGLGISWSDVRNVMDMRAVYGGFAAALKDLNVWVMNVVNVNAPDTLPIIYERGLFGIYHDWCESFSTYPRTYDFLHADRLFSKLKERCQLAPVMAEVDRIVRPGGKFIVRDDSTTIEEVENLLKSLHWEVHLTFSKNQEGILSATKSDWRPKLYAVS